ncbi:MAG: hypothetical protein Q9201_000151 [Fulgogasparrea decipioides]
MNGYGSSRERSPAFQGARLAFSSPSTAQKPFDRNDDGSHGALAAANASGRGGQKTVDSNVAASGRPYGTPTVAVRRHGSANSPYAAATLAAQRSTELLPNPTASLPSPNRPRPSSQRLYSDLTAISNTDGPSINALISRYEGKSSQVSKEVPLRQASGRRISSLNNLEHPFKSHSIRPTDTSSLSATRSSLILQRSSSSSTDSLYTSAVDEPPSRPHMINVQRTLVPSSKPLPRPFKTLDRARSSNTVNNVRPREEILSNSIIPHLSADSLANAMVASSLATSRAPSPTKPPLPPPRRHSGRPHLFHRTHSADEPAGSRTPSPSNRTMRTTMRAPLDPNEEVLAKQHKGNRFIHKHPNKHNEGDRKRWRDQITEFERKRYEGVWAANKGLLSSHYTQHLGDSTPPLNHPSTIDPRNNDNGVLNIVVRDIWSRSHLPADVLEEVWKLVDVTGSGVLGKEEFVVGMWLVDQRLKGRKLPVKVSESVWFSARGLVGVKVKRRC